MKSIKFAAFLMATVLMTLALCACGGAPVKSEAPTAETIEPLTDTQKQDYTADTALVGAVRDLSASFEGLEETEAGAFTYTVANGSATVSAVSKGADAIRVPEALGGVPVTALAEGALANHTGLKKLYLPDTLTSLGEGVLSGCDALVSLRTPLLGKNDTSDQFLGYLFGGESTENHAQDVPATLQYLELGGRYEKLVDFALFDCNDLVCVKLPETLREVGEYSFYHCSSLVQINLDGLKRIGAHAFDACEKLTRLELGASLESVGIGAFEGCSNVRRVTLPFVGGSRTENRFLGYLFGASLPDHASAYYPTYLCEVTLLDGCTALGEYAFYKCDTLTVLSLPNTLTAIGARAFDSCRRLTSLTLPAALKTVGANAFFNCISLQSLTFAEGSVLCELGINTFYNCYALKSVTLPQSLTALPASCFANCVSLSEVDLGGVLSVGEQAFRHCVALEKLTALDDVTFDSGNSAAETLCE